MVIIRLRLIYMQKNPLHRIFLLKKSPGGTKPNIRVRNANRWIGKFTRSSETGTDSL